MKNVIVERVIHDGESRVALRFPYDTELISVVKGFPGARWSATMKYWHVPDNPGIVSKLEELLKGKSILDYSVLEQAVYQVPNPAKAIAGNKSEAPGNAFSHLCLWIKAK